MIDFPMDVATMHEVVEKHLTFQHWVPNVTMNGHGTIKVPENIHIHQFQDGTFFLRFFVSTWDRECDLARQIVYEHSYRTPSREAAEALLARVKAAGTVRGEKWWKWYN